MKTKGGKNTIGSHNKRTEALTVANMPFVWTHYDCFKIIIILFFKQGHITVKIFIMLQKNIAYLN